MKRKILLLMVVLACTARLVHAQHTEPMSDSVRDSVAMQTTFYFSRGQGRWTKSNAYPKMLELLSWAKAYTTTLINSHPDHRSVSRRIRHGSVGGLHQ